MSRLQNLLFSQVPKSSFLELLIGGEQSNDLSATQSSLYSSCQKGKKSELKEKRMILEVFSGLNDSVMLQCVAAEGPAGPGVAWVSPTAQEGL